MTPGFQAHGSRSCCGIRHYRPDGLVQTSGPFVLASQPQAANFMSIPAATFHSSIHASEYVPRMPNNQPSGPRSSHRLSAVKLVPPRRRASSPMRSLSARILKDILGRDLPGITLLSTEEFRSIQLTRLSILKMSDGSKLVLSFAPSLAVRLLRQEATVLSTEALLLKFIDHSTKGERAQEEMKGNRREKAKEATDSSGVEGADNELDEDDKQDDEGEEEEGEDEEEKVKVDKSRKLSGLVPKLLKYSNSTHDLAFPYTIIEHTSGELLSDMAPFLSLPEHRDINRQVGTMARKLANLASPSGDFGMANTILPDPNRKASPTASPGIGCRTWSEGFNHLLEGILRDGEDMAVLLPYEVIRSHFQRLSWRLDAVKVPRLVILDVHDSRNIMIEREPDNEETMLPSQNIRMTGLRNWSQGIFGDPLMTCFDDSADGFRDGWEQAGEDIIEDKENSETRLLFYRCYRSVLDIVTEYYRPKGDSSKRELAGRRKLTQVLVDLEKVEVVEDNGSKRGWKSSSNAGASKRLKTGAEEEPKYDAKKA